MILLRVNLQRLVRKLHSKQFLLRMLQSTKQNLSQKDLSMDIQNQLMVTLLKAILFQQHGQFLRKKVKFSRFPLLQQVSQVHFLQLLLPQLMMVAYSLHVHLQQLQVLTNMRLLRMHLNMQVHTQVLLNIMQFLTSVVEKMRKNQLLLKLKVMLKEMLKTKLQLSQ